MDRELIWVDIDRVIPNPLNPRRDHAVKSKQMQDILKSKGWEEGITCYIKGQYYIILSGHRRWYAAKSIGEVQIPIFLVPSPNNPREELDRLGSVQGGQVDWTPYEWAKYTYDIWSRKKTVSYQELADKLGVSKNLVAARIRVFTYYPMVEIEDKLANGMYSITMLDYIHTWIKRLEKYHQELFINMGEELIRRQMLKKYENKCFNSQIANDKKFVKLAASQEILKFLTDINKKLQDCQLEMKMLDIKMEMDVTQNKLNLHEITDDIRNIKCRTQREAERLISRLDMLLDEITAKEQQLEGDMEQF